LLRPQYNARGWARRRARAEAGLRGSCAVGRRHAGQADDRPVLQIELDGAVERAGDLDRNRRQVEHLAGAVVACPQNAGVKGHGRIDALDAALTLQYDAGLALGF
jgi:hypothetical protein